MLSLLLRPNHVFKVDDGATNKKPMLVTGDNQPSTETRLLQPLKAWLRALVAHVAQVGDHTNLSLCLLSNKHALAASVCNVSPSICPGNDHRVLTWLS